MRRGERWSWPAARRRGCRVASAADDIVWWLAQVGFFDQTVETLPTPAARLAANPIATGHGGGHDLNLRTLQAMGVTLAGHFLGAEGGLAHFAPDLQESAAWGDQRFRELMGLIERFAAEHGLDVPSIDEPGALAARAPEWLDLSDFGVVIFAGGFRPDYRSWLPWPDAFDELGFPLQRGWRQHRRPRAVLRGRPFHAHAKVLALPRGGRGRDHRLPSRRRPAHEQRAQGVSAPAREAPTGG